MSSGCVSESIAAILYPAQLLNPPLYTTIQPSCPNEQGTGISIIIDSVGSLYSFDDGLTWSTNNTKNNLVANKHRPYHINPNSITPRKNREQAFLKKIEQQLICRSKNSMNILHTIAFSTTANNSPESYHASYSYIDLTLSTVTGTMPLSTGSNSFFVLSVSHHLLALKSVQLPHEIRN